MHYFFNYGEYYIELFKEYGIDKGLRSSELFGTIHIRIAEKIMEDLGVTTTDAAIPISSALSYGEIQSLRLRAGERTPFFPDRSLRKRNPELNPRDFSDYIFLAGFRQGSYRNIGLCAMPLEIIEQEENNENFGSLFGGELAYYYPYAHIQEDMTTIIKNYPYEGLVTFDIEKEVLDILS